MLESIGTLLDFAIGVEKMLYPIDNQQDHVSALG